MRYTRVAALKTPQAFSQHLAASQIKIAFDAALDPPESSPLAAPFDLGNGRRLANRFAILPMEGWDGTSDGHPSDLTRRRWQHFGESGACLMWGGEAVAVRHDGRANPRQLALSHKTSADIAGLADLLRRSHADRFGQASADGLYLGLQLTHSGRFARTDVTRGPEPLVAYAHPYLDRRFPKGVRILSDDDLDRLCDDFIAAARLVPDLGYDFVDLKHCHGYLGHELLSAVDRPGRYGGSLDNRLRFLRTIVEGIRATVPQLNIGVRLSAFDMPPYRPGTDRIGECEASADAPYPYAFGRVDDDDIDATMADSRAMLTKVREMGIKLICVTGGSPYYCPHTQRPALFPPSDGYEPPEDPLRGVARHLDATAHLKAAFPDMVFVGTGYSYLQEWLPHVGQHAVRNGHVDFVGLGRMVLSYPDLPADVLAGRPLRRNAICRTFSDCTTGPRNGLVSGCYPLDKFYGDHPDHAKLKVLKAGT